MVLVAYFGRLERARRQVWQVARVIKSNRSFRAESVAVLVGRCKSAGRGVVGDGWVAVEKGADLGDFGGFGATKPS